ncbi:MAG: protease inhibitor I42 family protein [Actinobacteria bacterium]|nr:protease inhibitor I42 family protein [Actinomycetota bacterium]
MNRFRLISIAAAVALLAFALTACGGSSSSTTATQTVTETQTQTETQQNTDQGQTTSPNGDTVYTEENTDVNVATGDSFTIQLPINPSTGYTWVPNIPMGYVQVSDTILESEDQGNIVGQGTAEQWVFSADTPGTGSITFDLMPPGQGAEAERRVTFIVHAS